MEEQPPPPSKGFMAQMKDLGHAGLQETQRRAHLASLKAKIEKLKLVNLSQAHYALGRRAYELRVAPEKFGVEYEEIADIEKRIAAKRTGVPVGENATAMDRAKGAAVGVKMRAEAEGLELKLKQRFNPLGVKIGEMGEVVGLESEVAGVQSVHSRIGELEAEYAAASADHGAQGELKNISASLAHEVGAKGRRVWRNNPLSSTNPKRRKILIRTGLGLLLLIVIVAIIAAAGSSNPQSPADPQVNETQGFNIGPIGYQHSYSGPDSKNPMHQQQNQ